MTEPFACIALACAFLADPLESCEKRHCPFAWQRRGLEDRARREEADRREGREWHSLKKGKHDDAAEPGQADRPPGGAVPPHSAGVGLDPGGRVGETAAPVVGEIRPPSGRNRMSLLCEQQAGALEAQTSRDVPGVDRRPFPPGSHTGHD
jgi:hypothetical protein